MLSTDPDLQEAAAELEDESRYDSIVICAGDGDRHRVKYGFNRGEDQTFREVVGTVQTCLHLMFQDHFFKQYLDGYRSTDD